MIILDQLTKVIGSKNVLSSVSLQIPTNRRIALLGGVDRDKQIIIELFAGAAMPTEGRVIRRAEVSFPVGHLPGFSRDLSVRLNVAHVARLYGANVRQTVEIVERALDIGADFDKPYENMGKNLRKPLAQIVAFALPFDVYMLTDDKFRATETRSGRNQREDRSAACFALFQGRLQTSGMIIPTDDPKFAQEFCDLAMVLQNGVLNLAGNVSAGFELLQQHKQDNAERRRLRRSGRRDRTAT